MSLIENIPFHRFIYFHLFDISKDPLKPISLKDILQRCSDELVESKEKKRKQKLENIEDDVSGSLCQKCSMKCPDAYFHTFLNFAGTTIGEEREEET